MTDAAMTLSVLIWCEQCLQHPQFVVSLTENGYMARFLDVVDYTNGEPCTPISSGTTFGEAAYNLVVLVAGKPVVFYTDWDRDVAVNPDVVTAPPLPNTLDNSFQNRLRTL